MMYGRKGLKPLAMPMAAWLAWLESASSMWSAMSIPATAPVRLQELLRINGRLTAERDALLAAAGTLDESRSKVAELQAVAQAAGCVRDEAAQRLAAILRESEAAQRKLDDVRSEAVARAKSMLIATWSLVRVEHAEHQGRQQPRDKGVLSGAVDVRSDLLRRLRASSPLRRAIGTPDRHGFAGHAGFCRDRSRPRAGA
jgi:hypothetical protein